MRQQRNSLLSMWEHIKRYSQHKPGKNCREEILVSSLNPLSTKEPYFTQSMSDSMAMRKSKLNMNSKRCSFCDELIMLTLPGELALELSCKHHCHRECYLISLDQNSWSLPSCNKCGAKTRCLDDQIHEEIIREKLAGRVVDIEYSTGTTTDTASGEQLLSLPWTSSKETLKESQFVYAMDPEEAAYKEAIKPSASMHSDKIEKVAENDFDVSCSVELRAPQITAGCKNTPNDTTWRQQIAAEVQHFFSSNVEQYASFEEELGEFLIFDYLDVSVNGIHWDNMLVSLFENALLMVEDAGRFVAGKITLDHDICNIHRDESVLNLNLDNDYLPEVQFRHGNPLVLIKWENYLNGCLRNCKIEEVPLLHTTCNAWNVIRNCNVPQEGLLFAKKLEEGSQIPESLLTKMIPPPPAAPLNLVVSICAINFTEQDNETYQSNIVGVLKGIRSKLRPVDKFGLIVVGVDGDGLPNQKATYYGCACCKWSIWDEIIDSIGIFSPFEGPKGLLDNGYREVTIALEKFRYLMPSIFETQHQNINSVNKFIMINSRSCDFGELNPSIEATLSKNMIHMHKNNISVDLVKIGNRFVKEIEKINKIITKPIQEDGMLRVVHGNRWKFFNSFAEFQESPLSVFACGINEIFIPAISVLFLKKTESESLVSFSHMEVNCESITPKRELDSINICIQNVDSKKENYILVKLRLHFDDSNKIGDLDELPILDYRENWLGEIGASKCLSAKFSDRLIDKSYREFPVSPTIEGVISEFGKDSYSVSIPLVSPPFSPQDYYFNSKKTELSLTIIENLKKISCDVGNEENILQGLVSFISDFLRGLLFADRKGYFMALIFELQKISALFKSDPRIADLACNDFAEWVMSPLSINSGNIRSDYQETIF